MVVTLAGCSPDCNKAERLSELSDLSQEKENGYSLTVEDNFPIENELKQYYQVGDEVTIKLATATEQYYILSVNGEKQQQINMDEEYTYFAFTMPDENAVISIKEVSVDIPETSSADRNAVIIVTSGGKVVIPYQHLAYSLEWFGEGFIAADGTWVAMELPRLTAEGLIPGLVYEDDFSVSYGENVSYYMIHLFNESFERLDDPMGIDALSALNRGEYYVSIVVNEQGEYVEAADEYENTGWACVFSLQVV